MDNQGDEPYHAGSSSAHGFSDDGAVLGDRGYVMRSHVIVLLMGLTVLGLPSSPAAFAADPAPIATPPGGAPTPVNTQDHPDALLLNAKNPLVRHAGPGKPNVGHVYVPPTLSGKDKGKGQKAGQTEETVMGATPK